MPRWLSEQSPAMNIVRARPGDAELLTRIAIEAKRSWGYPEHWIELWRELLTIRPEQISEQEIHLAPINGKVIGFYALQVDGHELSLEHLWVLPEGMRGGVGRMLFEHAVERAKAMRFSLLKIESDPNAEGFYQRMGARRVGARSTQIFGRRRELPLLVYQID
jgi:ribosomal protein S18 acetylase RimI-like enzyme